MRRRLFNLAAAAALAVCAGCIVLFVACPSVPPSTRVHDSAWHVDVSAAGIVVTKEFRFPRTPGPINKSPNLRPIPWHVNATDWAFLGAHWHEDGAGDMVVLSDGVYGSRSLSIPLWQPMVLSAAASVVLWWMGRSTRSDPDRCCVRCGYDLRATPERCPECGTAVASAAARPAA